MQFLMFILMLSPQAAIVLVVLIAVKLGDGRNVLAKHVCTPQNILLDLGHYTTNGGS